MTAPPTAEEDRRRMSGPPIIPARTKWKTSDDSVQVIAAWVKALQTMEDIRVDAKVEAGPMRYKYATLSAVLDEVRPKLAEHGLVLTQYVSDEGVATIIFHESGQWMSFPPLLIKPVGGTPQHVGSATSYARRYSILSLCNLATEDDDGAAASVAPHPASTAEDPIANRVDELMRRMRGLNDPDKTALKSFADGRSLSANTLYNDHDWLSEVEAYLDEGLGYDGHDDDLPDDGDDRGEDTPSE